MKHTLITVQRLKDVLQYDYDSGLFTWKVATGNRVRVGCRAGSTSISKGYIKIMVDGKTWCAHRLAWLYMHGEFPKNQIDHINGIRCDNRIINLRDVSPMVNSQNRRCATKNRKEELPLGVHKVGSKTKPFQANIRVSGVSKYLGTFKTPHEAHEVYITAKRQMHSGCTI